MAIGTATAIGLGLAAASAGTQVVAAKKASTASKKAAEDQMRATDDARRTIDQTWSPYVNYGRQSISTLGRLTSAPPGAKFAAPDPTLPQPTRSPMATPRPVPDGRPRTLGGLVPSGADGQTVRLRAPDGEQRDVPVHLADHYIARGATRI